MLVPTRDRPDLLGFCLEGLAEQTFPDIEVVVADNPVQQSAREVFERWRKDGWRYVRAPEPLAMHDNWEYGLERTTGEFVAVVIDKTILHPSALQLANGVLETDPGAELVSWWNDGYNPADESADVGGGILIPTPATRDAEQFDPTVELRKLFSLDERRGEDPVRYYRGKVCFGAYSRALLTRIKGTCGRVFYPLSPDYTSRVPALALTRGAVDMGRPLLVSYNSRRSNGRRVGSTASYAESFVLGAEPEALQCLPIPGLYSSIHNLVAYDYVTSARRLASQSPPDLNATNLVRRAREDLEHVSWDSEQQRDEQYRLLEAEEARVGIGLAPPEETDDDVAEPPRPPLGPRRIVAAIRWRLNPPEPEPAPEHPVFSSPVAAAVAADRLYASLGGGITL